MTDTFLQITEDEFDQGFPLLPNHLDPQAGWAVGAGPGSLFGTSPEEMAFVLAQPPGHVWTWVEGDEGMYLLSGVDFVNRIGYLISTRRVDPDTIIEIRLEEVPSE
jgi:hypothetical protein